MDVKLMMMMMMMMINISKQNIVSLGSNVLSTYFLWKIFLDQLNDGVFKLDTSCHRSFCDARYTQSALRPHLFYHSILAENNNDKNLPDVKHNLLYANGRKVGGAFKVSCRYSVEMVCWADLPFWVCFHDLTNQTWGLEVVHEAK